VPSLIRPKIDVVSSFVVSSAHKVNPDRLARNSVDGGRIVYLVDTGKIQDLRFPTFHFESTAHGEFMLNIAFCQSK
jgi:hypothetical protein